MVIGVPAGNPAVALRLAVQSLGLGFANCHRWGISLRRGSIFAVRTLLILLIRRNFLELCWWKESIPDGQAGGRTPRVSPGNHQALGPGWENWGSSIRPLWTSADQVAPGETHKEQQSTTSWGLTGRRRHFKISRTGGLQIVGRVLYILNILQEGYY